MPQSAHTNTCPALFPAAPALPYALALILGIFSVLAPAQTGIPVAAAALLGLAGGAALFLGWPCCRRQLAITAAAGLALAALHLWRPWQTYRRHLSRLPYGAEIEGVITDHEYGGGDLDWLRPGARRLLALQALRPDPSAPWAACRGTVVLQPPPGTVLRYGMRLRAQGTFFLPAEPVVAGAFDYAGYLRSKGIDRVFAADAITVQAGPRGRRRGLALLYRCRDAAAARLVAGLGGDRDRRFLLAMTLGYRRGLDPVTREQFLRSGAVHLFAISGLHVGIVASVLLSCLCLLRVPFRIRYGIVPVLLGLYVLSTGSAASAVRAWIMVTIWCAGKSLLRPTAALNSVATAAVLLLLWNPYHLVQVGFQFSFVVVTALALAWPLISFGAVLLRERSLWLPRRARSRTGIGALVLHGWRAAGVSVIAWLASAGLVAWVNQLLIPAAVLVNLLLSGLAWLILFLSIPKLLCAGLVPGWADAVLAVPLQVLLELVRTIVRLGSAGPGSLPVPRPAVWFVASYYFLALLALLPWQRTRWRLAAGSVLVLALCALPLLRCDGDRAPRLVVFHGGQTATPVVLVVGPAREPTLALNAGGPELGRAVGNWLRLHGVGTLDTLLLPSRRWAASAGSAALLRTVVVRTLALPPKAREGAGFEFPDGLGPAPYRVRVMTRSRTESGSVLRLTTGYLELRHWQRTGERVWTLRRRLPGSSLHLRMRQRATGETLVQGRWNNRSYPALLLEPGRQAAVTELMAGADGGGDAGTLPSQ